MKIIDSIREDLKNKEYILIMSNDIRQIMSDILDEVKKTVKLFDTYIFEESYNDNYNGYKINISLSKDRSIIYISYLDSVIAELINNNMEEKDITETFDMKTDDVKKVEKTLSLLLNLSS